ncbi:MAG: xanthine dehydrogenase family protein molybdopterin-binding subunit [Alphaproteobacteria bacterium]|jgi:2-furoyl-CoA dehydrogenase large subunit|nr:xanthine dehydrogenase family protein molybdopterin-binding subunit [Alphaproteobacteria bacterium]
MVESVKNWLGQAVPRFEDEALMTGNARFIDDLSPVPGIRHVAILRSPYAHAEIRSIDLAPARELAGVIGAVSGQELMAGLEPLASVVRAPMNYFPMAADKVRYVGEPVALVAAEDRYLAEDAIEAIEVDYEPLGAVVDPIAGQQADAALLHEAVGSNLVHQRTFRYGEPEAAFEAAEHIVRLNWRYPRQSSTPMETYGAIAQFEAAPDRYTIWSNFQGPFILQPLMARALKIPGNHLRLISAPHSGGSFGIKQGLYPYLVLLAAASRHFGCPLKWIEDRLEHLSASSAAAARADGIEAAFDGNGMLTGLRFANCVDVGAYVRAPEPASVYRMQAASNGSYQVRHIAIENRLVVTNKTPIGLNRGYGGPQFYFGLERAMEVAARRLDLDPAEIRRRNFLPASAFPYDAPGGAVYDAGDYGKGLDMALELTDYPELRARRAAAKAEGRLFGIGLAAGVEPSGSNMAYVTLALTPEERAKAGGRSGGLAAASVSIDPSGSVTVHTDSTPAGQGHATVAAQVAADRLGLEPRDIQVITAIDTQSTAWSLASGNYSNRFAAIEVGAIAESADRIGHKLRRIAGEMLEVAAEDIELAGGRAHVTGAPEQGIALARVAAASHWHPAGLPDDLEPGLDDTTMLSPAVLGAPDEGDRVASAVTFGFLCDLTAVEIDRDTGRIRIDTYVSVHDVGRVLNPIIVEGQVRGGFAHGFGAAMFEDLAYDEAGNFLSGSFADYLCPTAPDLPEVKIGHYETASPQNPLGSKGMGDGSSMLAPAAIANAVADALERDDIELPLTLDRVWRMANELGEGE